MTRPDVQRLAVPADELRPFDTLADGDAVEQVTFGKLKFRPWPDKDYRAILVHAGTLTLEHVPTGIPDPATVLAPRWDNIHEVWFDFGEEVIVLRPDA